MNNTSNTIFSLNKKAAEKIQEINNLRNKLDEKINVFNQVNNTKLFTVKLSEANFYKPRDPVTLFNFKDKALKFAGDRNKEDALTAKPYVLSSLSLDSEALEYGISNNIEFHKEIKYLTACAIKNDNNKIQITNWHENSSQLHSIGWCIKCQT